MAKKVDPERQEELELDKAYWELTGYKFNRKNRPSLLLILLLIAAAAAACWYFDLPELLQNILST